MKKFLTGLSLFLSIACSQPALAIDEGIDYLRLTPAQPTETKQNQIEIIEFFWYRCPHCFHLEPELNAWAKKLPKNVVLRRVPGVLNDQWIPLTRAFYALEAMGLSEKLHGDVFDAIHNQKIDLNTPETFFSWATNKGVDKNKLINAYNSFGVNSKTMKAKEMSKAYKLSGVPAIAVNGKYTTSAYMTGSQEKLFEAVNELIEIERKSKRGKN
ncbi:MAG: thiol:disulfide interchange protein DsbA/DsbL [Bacteroidales bacterium]|nr:thiol:disulfide interchange protein DsbA/DsbL [Bacteroidales bacterium]